jgi:hypothetical protein
MGGREGKTSWQVVRCGADRCSACMGRCLIESTDGHCYQSLSRDPSGGSGWRAGDIKDA